MDTLLCSSTGPKDEVRSPILWAESWDGQHVTLLEKMPGCKMSSLTLSCGCTRTTLPVSEMGGYLERVFAGETFDKLVLMGKPEALETMRQAVPPALRYRIITEIIRQES